MLTTTLPRRIFFAMVGLAAYHAWHLSQVLPPRVASHFDAAGVANGWMERDAFVMVYAGVIALMTVMFLGIGLMERLPDSAINLPNKPYWLDPSRRAATFAWMRGWSSLFGAGTLALMVGIMQLAANVNLGEAETLGDRAWVLLGGFVAFAVALSVLMILRFAQKPAGGPARPGDPS